MGICIISYVGAEMSTMYLRFQRYPIFEYKRENPCSGKIKHCNAASQYSEFTKTVRTNTTAMQPPRQLPIIPMLLIILETKLTKKLMFVFKFVCTHVLVPYNSIEKYVCMQIYEYVTDFQRSLFWILHSGYMYLYFT